MIKEIKSTIVEVVAAFQFLTLLPPLIKRPFIEKELGRSSGYYPLVGLFLGMVLTFIYSFMENWFPIEVAGLAVLIFWVVSTRALHIDGFMDSCDGLFGGFTSERRLEIMRDSRVGAFGVVGGVLMLLSKYVLLSFQNHPEMSLLLAPVFGRWVLTFGIVGFSYARENGMGKDIKANARWPQLMIATIITLSAALYLAGWLGVAIFFVVSIVAYLLFRYVSTLIPGLTGDVYGAVCEITELVVMLVFIPVII